MLLTNGLMGNEVLRWKAIGAAAWVAAITIAATAAWSVAAAPGALFAPLRLLGGLLRPAAWLAAAALVVAQAPAFAVQAGALRAAEPRPVQAHRLLRLPGLAGGSVVVSRLAARCASVAGVARTASFLGLHALSAVLWLSFDSATRSAAPHGPVWTLQFGAWLAGVYLLHWAYWGQDVLLFPAVQRHRYFRLKQRLPTAAAHAARLAAAAFAGAAATAVVRARALGSAPPPLTLGGSAAALLAGWLCAFCWLAGTAALEVVFTERLRPDDYSDRDVLGAMAACLTGARGELMQSLALHDASHLASDVGKASLRRADLFLDESGDRWRPVAAACIAELDGLSTAVAAGLLQQKAAGGTAAGGAASAQSAHKWNVLPSGIASKGGLGSSRPQVEALLAVRCGYPRAALAAQALAGFGCASLKEDRYGILQLTQARAEGPGLGDVLLCLLGTLGATQQLLRATASLAPRQLSLGPWRGDGDAAPYAGCYATQALDAAAHALQDTITVALYRLADAFGEGLAKALADCKGAPAFGSTADAAALLRQFLQGQS